MLTPSSAVLNRKSLTVWMRCCCWGAACCTALRKTAARLIRAWMWRLLPAHHAQQHVQSHRGEDAQTGVVTLQHDERAGCSANCTLSESLMGPGGCCTGGCVSHSLVSQLLLCWHNHTYDASLFAKHDVPKCGASLQKLMLSQQSLP